MTTIYAHIFDEYIEYSDVMLIKCMLPVCYPSLARGSLTAHIVASSHPVTTISPTTIIQIILDGISIYLYVEAVENSLLLEIVSGGLQDSEIVP